MPLPSFLARIFGRLPEPAPPEALPDPEPEPTPPRPPLDAAEALRVWLNADERLRTLYRSLGVSPSLEERCAAWLERAKTGVRVEIPDAAAFLEALERLAEKAAEPNGDAAWAMRGSDPLLLDVLSRRHNFAAVLMRLGERPADELLPFLEEIPARRGGEVVWRLPRELALIRRRPERPEDFLAVLAALGEEIGGATLERSSEMREALLEALGRVERDAADPAAYLPSSLRALEEKLGEWLAAPSAEQRERRRILDRFLVELLAVRYALEAPRPIPGAEASIARARTIAAEALKSSWLASPPLLSALLHLLLLAELAPRPPGGAGATATLEATAAEMAGGFFDPVETARRLRQLEAQDCWVFSPIFALLRLAAPPGAGA